MNTFTIEDVRSWEPCYDPIVHIPEGWFGDARDIWSIPTITLHDKLWTILREGVVSENLLQTITVWCALQTKPFAEISDFDSKFESLLLALAAPDRNDKLLSLRAALIAGYNLDVPEGISEQERQRVMTSRGVFIAACNVSSNTRSHATLGIVSLEQFTELAPEVETRVTELLASE